MNYDRDIQGRFVPGNQAALGNRGGGRPSVRNEVRILHALSDAIDDETLRIGIGQVVEKFKQGERWAVQFVFDQLVGKPGVREDESVKPDLVELLRTWDDPVDYPSPN